MWEALNGNQCPACLQNSLPNGGFVTCQNLNCQVTVDRYDQQRVMRRVYQKLEEEKLQAKTNE